MNIPLVDLKKQYQSIKEEINKEVLASLEKADFIQGENVRKFEEEFCTYLRKKKDGSMQDAVYCATCANGTDALYLSLLAFGIKQGDEVITVSHTFIADLEAIAQVGATPVFVDIDPSTMLMDIEQLKANITPNTKAIIVVHLYGQACNMDAIMDIARQHSIRVIEDCAQAHGAYWKDKKVGTFGDLATFSFFPGKNLGAYGDAGAVVSTNKELFEKVKMIANHGRIDKYEHLVFGVNSRLDTLQATVLRVKLKYLEKWTQLRQDHANYYTEQLKDTGLELPAVEEGSECVWHLYVVRTPFRDELLKYLQSKNIQAGVHYPIPLHMQPAYKNAGYAVPTLEVTEQCAKEILSLPIYPELEKAQQDYIISAVKEFLLARV